MNTGLRRSRFIVLLALLLLSQPNALAALWQPVSDQVGHLHLWSTVNAQSPDDHTLFLPGIAVSDDGLSRIELSGLDALEASLAQVDISAENFQLPEYVPGEVLLTLKPDVALDRIAEINQEHQTRTLRRFVFIHTAVLKLPSQLSVIEAIDKLQHHPLVESVEPNYLHYLNVTATDDPRLEDLWGLDNQGQDGGTPDADIDALEAWDIETGSRDVVVAVIDSGVDMTHPDLAANIWTNPGEISGNGFDDDGNGFVDDLHGWDFSSGDNDPSPAGSACAGHGTHVAGTIGAVGNNATGVTGVNWNVSIMPIKAFRVVLGRICTADDAALIAAIEYHTLMGVPISSNSWGGALPSKMTALAIRASNSLFVAAAGNEGMDNDSFPSYPANLPLNNIIAVAASDRNDQLANFSNYGVVNVDLAAPGVDILSTLPNDSYDFYSGTSMATPHVSGVAALLLSQDPTLTPYEIHWRILNGVDPVGLPVATQGRLNAYNSLQYGLVTPVVTVAVIPQGSTDVSPGTSFSVQLDATNHDTVAHSTSLVLYGRLENGKEIVLSSSDISLDPGATSSTLHTIDLPANIPTGATIQIFGQAETAQSFDESWVTYTVIP